jgi:hypothetical protein
MSKIITATEMASLYGAIEMKWISLEEARQLWPEPEDFQPPETDTPPRVEIVGEYVITEGQNT